VWRGVEAFSVDMRRDSGSGSSPPRPALEDALDRAVPPGSGRDDASGGYGNA